MHDASDNHYSNIYLNVVFITQVRTTAVNLCYTLCSTLKAESDFW